MAEATPPPPPAASDDDDLDLDVTWLELSEEGIREAGEKSRAAVNTWIRHDLQQELDDGNIDGRHRNLFLVNSSFLSSESTVPCSWEVRKQAEWGRRDVMIDLREWTQEQRMEYLGAAANFRGDALSLCYLWLDEEEEKAWLDALVSVSHAAGGPKSLLISKCSFNACHLLTALNNSQWCVKGGPLKLLSLHHMDILTEECVELLARLASLTALVLTMSLMSPDLVGRLAELHPSHSPLPSSLQVLCLSGCQDFPASWRRAAPAFMDHWPQLKHLILLSSYDEWMSEDDLIIIMEHYLAAAVQDSGSSLKKAGTDYDQEKMNIVAAAPASEHDSTSVAATASQLLSLALGWFKRTNEGRQLSQRAVAAVADALSKSGLPFLQLLGISDLDPAIEAQLQRNRRLWKLGDLERVPATSIRLFICGDPYAGKTTLVSTLHSIYSDLLPQPRIRKKWTHRWRAITCCCGGLGDVKPQVERTRGIEIRAITSDNVRISLWDMAGQEEFHAFHDYMFPDIATASSNQSPSLFMFVWSPIRKGIQSSDDATSKKTRKEFEESFRYWLKFLASKSRKSNTALQVIVVFTHADQLKAIKASVLRELRSLQEQFKGIIDILVDNAFEVNAGNEGSVKGLGEYTFEIARKMLHGAEVYDICKQVSDHLIERARKERIITWSQFRGICMDKRYIPGDAESKLRAIALSLNESGNIIYGIQHIILDPNWFCNDILGSLIRFPEGNRSSGVTSVIIEGLASRGILESKLEELLLTSRKELNQSWTGSILVDLMEEMHLCCKVPPRDEDRDPGKEDRACVEYFVPATLPDHTTGTSNSGIQQLGSWIIPHSDHVAYTHVGRRLACQNNDLNFLTPGLFPRIQVLLSNAFGNVEGSVEIKLGKHFISIYVLQSVEIIVLFIKAKADNVIDVLARAPCNQEEHVARALANVQDHIIDTLIKVCAQPKGIQGATLTEHVIRPECLLDPSNARSREDQCVEMNTLKQRLRSYIEQGLPERYAWKQTMENVSPTTSFLDLLGYKNYLDVLTAYKAWLEETMQSNKFVDDGSLEKGEPSARSNEQQHQRHHNMVSLLHTLDEKSRFSSTKADQAPSKVEVEVVSTQNMANEVFKEILRLHGKELDELATKKKLDEMRGEVESMKGNVLRMFQELVADRILKSSDTCAETDQMPVPRLVYFKASGVYKMWESVTSLLGDNVKLELCCEYRKSPHRVEKQPGMSLTSLSASLRKHLDTALPYINGILWILSAAAKAGLNSIAPPAGSFIPDIFRLPNFKASQQHPLIPITPRNASTFVAHNTSELYKEWQKCFTAMLIENYGAGVDIERKINERFLLYHVDYKDAYGSSHVAWLCPKHYRDHHGLHP